MLNPADDPVIRARAADRSRQSPFRTASLEQLIADVRDEILMSLVALFDVRDLCPVDIRLLNDPVITRMELFDKSVYLSWYQGPDSPEQPYPETVRFDSDSFMYQVERLATAKQFEDSRKVTHFDPGHTDKDLLAYMSGLMGIDVEAQDLAGWRARYEQFMREHQLI
jgi:hypothetical protein